MTASSWLVPASLLASAVALSGCGGTANVDDDEELETVGSAANVFNCPLDFSYLFPQFPPSPAPGRGLPPLVIDTAALAKRTNRCASYFGIAGDPFGQARQGHGYLARLSVTPSPISYASTGMAEYLCARTELVVKIDDGEFGPLTTTLKGRMSGGSCVVPQFFSTVGWPVVNIEVKAIVPSPFGGRGVREYPVQIAFQPMWR
jgi:hypothetical protein